MPVQPEANLPLDRLHMHGTRDAYGREVRAAGTRVPERQMAPVSRHEQRPMAPVSRHEQPAAPPRSDLDISDAPAADRPRVAAPAATPAEWRSSERRPSDTAVPGRDYRDFFRSSTRSSTTFPKRDESNPPRFRAAVEMERWRNKLSDSSKYTRDKEDKLDSYRQPAQAEWARERLVGTERRRENQREEEQWVFRRERTVAQAWRPSAAHLVDVVAIDQLEETIRKRLGELESNAAVGGRSARAFFAECDPQRQGRVLLLPFVDAMGRKLNFDFPPRGGLPGSREVLAALFRRYDLERIGIVAADDFHAALTGASREGRASGRVVNAIGRLREGIVRHAGGYDSLREADARWFRMSKERGLPTGCLTAGAFIDELMELALLAEVPLREADLVTLLDAFEPPPEAFRGESADARRAMADAEDPLVSFDEVTLAIRGPPMGSSRVQISRAAYAALKEDAKFGLKSIVRPAHLADRYDVSRHPAVLNKSLDEEVAAMAFLRVWCVDRESLDKEVSVKEFCDRYEWLSTLYDDDREFEAMMRAAWRLK